MDYDKNSFLAGLSVGRTLKGWAGAADQQSDMPNGRAWTEALNSGTDTINNLKFCGNQWVAVYQSGKIYTSPDGTDWTLTYTFPFEFSTSGTGFAYLGGRFLVSVSGGNYVSTNLIDWIPMSFSLSDVTEETTYYTISHVCFGKNVYIAYLSYQTASDRFKRYSLVHSGDGVNWTGKSSSKTTTNGDSLRFVNGLFFHLDSASGAFEGRIVVSRDGVSWSKADAPGPSAYSDYYPGSIYYGNGLYICEIEQPEVTKDYMYSYDGYTWYAANVDADLSGNIDYNIGFLFHFINDVWFTYLTSTGKSFRSFDGLVWEELTLNGASAEIVVTAYINGMYLGGRRASMDDYTDVNCASYDGLSWFDLPLGSNGSYTYYNYDTGIILTPIDGHFWYSQNCIAWTDSGQDVLSNVGYQNGVWVASKSPPKDAEETAFAGLMYSITWKAGK